jgi:hypothetical protein
MDYTSMGKVTSMLRHLRGFLTEGAAAVVVEDKSGLGVATAAPPADDTRFGFPSAHLQHSMNSEDVHVGRKL